MAISRIPLVAVFLSFAVTAGAQTDGWTLGRCIEYARENNIQVRQAQINKENSDEDLLQAKEQALPSLSASVGQDFRFSKVQESIDGDYALKGSYNGSYGLNSSMTLYNGGRIRNNQELSEINNSAYALDILDAQNDIEVAVVQAYLSILYAREAVTTAENTLAASKAQRDRALEMQKEGVISLSEYAQMDAQYTSDNYSLVNSRNNLSESVLNLKQLLELGIDTEFSVAFPELGDTDVLQIVPTVAQVYATALEEMPDMESSRLGIEAAKINEKIAQSSMIPSLSLNASLGTSNASGYDTGFFEQLSNGLNGGVGLTLSVPIYSNRSARTSVAKARNSTRQSELSYQSAQKNLLATIESLHQDAVSSQSRYIAAQKKLESAELSYSLVNEKYNEGMINAVELLTEKNTYTAAQQELNQAKYQAILSLQLLKFYQNQPIEL